MAHQVFICHSSKDKLIADAACAAIEAQRISCWIAPRDVLPGEEYGKAIVEGLAACDIVLLIFSKFANESPQVRREVERAVSKGKIILPFRIEDVLPSDAMEFAISTVHWLDAITPPIERRLVELCESIAVLLKLEPEAMWHHSVTPETAGAETPVQEPAKPPVQEAAKPQEPAKPPEAAKPQEPDQVRTCPQCSKRFTVLNKHCPVDGAALSEPHDPTAAPPAVDTTPGRVVLYAKPKNGWNPLNDAMSCVFVKVGNKDYEMKWGQRTFDLRPGLQYMQVGVRSEFQSGLKSVAEVTLTLKPGEVRYVRYSSGLGPLNRGTLEVNLTSPTSSVVQTPGVKVCGTCQRAVPAAALFCPGCGSRQ